MATGKSVEYQRGRQHVFYSLVDDALLHRSGILGGYFMRSL